jgi:hypothetical protein
MEVQDLMVIGDDVREYRLWGKTVRARKLITRLQGMESTVYVDEQGNALMEFGPMGLVMRQEPMERALEIADGSGKVDFLEIYSVKPLGAIANPRNVTRARYRVGGVEMGQLARVSSRQQVAAGESGVVDVGLPASSPGQAEDLERCASDAPFIESRDPAIRAAAQSAVSGAEDRLDSLQRLTDWVFAAIKKESAAGIPSALAVLQKKTGDCNEHSVLFTAMARSLGIPTRIELGLVFQGGRFYYHAWPAAWIGDRWIEFDPTFGQRRADAARLALAAGDMSNALELVGMIGNITIEILAAE